MINYYKTINGSIEEIKEYEAGCWVNCVAPGGYSPGLADDPEKKAFVETYIENCPLGRWADEDDIKGPVVFLASDAASYVTGATIVMDGGWTIW